MKILQSNITLIILILVGIVVGIYSYVSNRPYEPGELTTLQAQLDKTPVLHELGEGTQYYNIEVELKGIDKRFFFRDCAYDLVDVKKVLNLKNGSAVELTVESDEYAKKEKLDIYSFADEEEGEILSLDDYNSCHASVWRYTMPFIVLIGIILLYRLLIMLRLLKPVVNGDKKSQ